MYQGMQRTIHKVTTVTNLKLEGTKLIDTEMVGQIKSPEWSMNSTTLALS